MLQQLLGNQDLLTALVKQLNKDFATAHCLLGLATDATPQHIIETTALGVEQVIEANQLNLLLYSVDVSEKMLQSLDSITPQTLTYLVLKRTWQKVCYRKFYGG